MAGRHNDVLYSIEEKCLSSGLPCLRAKQQRGTDHEDDSQKVARRRKAKRARHAYRLPQTALQSCVCVCGCLRVARFDQVVPLSGEVVETANSVEDQRGYSAERRRQDGGPI